MNTKNNQKPSTAPKANKKPATTRAGLPVHTGARAGRSRIAGAS